MITRRPYSSSFMCLDKARLAHSSSSSVVAVHALEEYIEACHRGAPLPLCHCTEVKAEHDAVVRGVTAMSSKLDHVRADMLELVAEQKELAAQLHAVESELAKVSTEAQFVPTIKANIEAMRHEIQRGR
ncbi:Protein FLX-like 1 [Glycine max]|nr:Protein FLX-like 1 [Glycine max]